MDIGRKGTTILKLPRWLRQWLSGGSARPAGSRRARSTRLQVEQLEERAVPAALLVTSLADTTAAGTLRGEIMIHNSEATPTADNVLVSSTLFTNGQATIVLGGTQLPAITGTLTLNLAANRMLAINANNASGALAIASGATVNLTGLTIVNGNSTSGGGITNNGTLNLTNSTIEDCVGGNGGGILNTGTLNILGSTLIANTGIQGGGLDSTGGVLTVINSTITQNQSTSNGGGVYVAGTAATMRNATVAFNQADETGPTPSGGGIYVAGTGGSLVLHNTLVAGNIRGTGTGTPDDIAGTVDPSSNNNLVGDTSSSGGLTNGTNANIVGVDPATVLESTPNQANTGGVTATLPLLVGSPAVDAGNNADAINASGAALTTDQRGTVYPRIVNGAVDIGAYEGLPPLNLVVTSLADDGSAGTLRAAIQAANISATVDTITFAPSLFTSGPATLTLNGTELPVITEPLNITGPGANELTISGNNQSRIFENSGPATTVSGLTLTNGYVTGSLNGGAVCNDYGATLTLDSVIIQNSVTTTEGGGGIFTGGTLLVVINSALIGNSAGLRGGGLDGGSGLVSIINTTISENQAPVGGGVGGDIDNPTFRNSTIAYNIGGGIDTRNMAIYNTIVAGNTLGGIPNDIAANTINDGESNNLIGDAATSNGLLDGVNGDIVGVPVTSVLAPAPANNGGTTPTILLLPGSPALNAGSNALAVDQNGQPLTSDQRGAPFQRVVNGTVDIGAFESNGFTLTPVSGSNQSTAVNTAFAAPLVVQVFSVDTGLPMTGGAVLFTGPASGASATFTGATMVSATGYASAIPTANAVAGSYAVTASAPGSTGTATFNLTNNATIVTPTVSVNGPISLTYGAALANSQLSGTATAFVNGNTVNVPGTFTYTTNSGVVLGAGNGQSEAVTFTPNDTVDFTTASTTVTVNVAKATPTASVNGPINLTYGAALANSQLSGTAVVNGNSVNVPGTFTYTTNSGVVLGAGNGQSEAVTFTPNDTVDFTTAATTVTVNVAQATPTVNVTDAGGYYTGAAYAATATITGINGTPGSTLEGHGLTLTYYSGTYTSVSQLTGLTGSGTAPSAFGSYTVLASFAGSTDYVAVKALANFTITFTAAAFEGEVEILNGTTSGALNMSSNAHLNVAGALQIDSNSSTAANLSGNAIASAGQTTIVGGDQLSGNARFTHAPTLHGSAAANPLAGLAAPNVAGSYGAVNVTGNNSLTINPGNYTSITVSGNGKLTMNPGIYVIGSGGISFSGNAIVTGQGVLLYNAGALSLSSNANVNLTAMSTGANAGLAIFQATSDTSAVTVTDNGILNLHGAAIYDANTQSVVTLTSNAQVDAALIINELTMSGNAIVTAS